MEIKTEDELSDEYGEDAIVAINLSRQIIEVADASLDYDEY